MITWVLILILSNGFTSSTVFHSPQSCNEARDQVLKLAPKDVTAMCIQDMNINN